MRNRSHRQEVKTIAEYITAETIIPPYLPYPRFLFSETSRETFTDKVVRLIENDKDSVTN